MESPGQPLLFDRSAALGGLRLQIIDLSFLTGLQAPVIAAGNRQGQDAVVQAVEVDPEYLLRLFLGLLLCSFCFVLLLLLCLRRLGRLNFLLFFLLRRLLLVALFGQRRWQILSQHREVDRVRHPHVGVGLVKPVLDRPGVGAPEKVEVLTALVEDRFRGFT